MKTARWIEVEGFGKSKLIRRKFDGRTTTTAVIVKWLRESPPRTVSELARFRVNDGPWQYIDGASLLKRAGLKIRAREEAK